MYRSRLFQLMPRLMDDMSSQMASMLRLSEELSRLSDYKWAPRFGRQNLLDVPESELPEIQNSDKEFNIHLELPQFKPEEVKISSDNNTLTINAKRQEKLGNSGFVSSEITRTYSLPEDVDPKSVTSAMSRNGILKIMAQKKEGPRETPIPIDYKSDKS